MHDQAFNTLQYDELRKLVERYAQTPMGRARTVALAPANDLAELQSALAAVSECVKIRSRGASWSFDELKDPGDAIRLLRVEGAALDPPTILGLGRLCEQAMSARSAILAEREKAPVLLKIVESLPKELNSLTARIANKILPSGELDDRASPELARVRHEINRLRSNITRSLESLMRRSEDAIQDEVVTIRNDRFVVPVRADHQGRVKGVAHGFSSSGATTFIEPLETIEANNELQALREAEQREIAKVLFALTDELRAQLPAIESAADAVAELDFINARAVFSEKFSCVIPEVGGGQALEFLDARHPLLEENLRAAGGSVVPVSFSLDEDHSAMIISGANAGGKTVVLKTAGLLSLMALSGLPVPAREARVPFYKTVLADIGDHQSIAANLSTFTSHVANIARMIELCESPALVLLDEVGTGTDPEEGSALGVAVVDHFRRACYAHVIATTHYSGLKMYAANETGVLNASVEFDEKTLQPTYRLIVGVAGTSSGLEIAQRFGVPREIIGVASEQVKESSQQAAEYLKRIKRESEEAEAMRKALEQERAAVAEKFAFLDRDAERRERDRQREFETALAEGIDEFRKRSQELAAQLEDQGARMKLEKEAEKRAAELKREAKRAVQAGSKSSGAFDTRGDKRAVRVVRDGKVVDKSVADKQESVELRAEAQYFPTTAREIRIGDRVRLPSFGKIGIVDGIKDDEAEVRVGSLHLREKLDKLELVEEVAPKKDAGKFAKLKRNQAAEVVLSKEQANGRSELNVIGQRADAAVDAVDKFLDEAFLSGLSEVRIVHGHGTGALRKAISELLKDHQHVAKFAAAPQNQGGTGATLVELRQ